jgi:hypothetical protein
MEYLKGFDKDEWELVEFDEIKKGDYIMYYTKKMTYQDGQKKKESLRRGGYVSFINNDEKFIGIINYGRKWSVQNYNVEYYYKSKIQKQRLKKSADLKTN